MDSQTSAVITSTQITRVKKEIWDTLSYTYWYKGISNSLVLRSATFTDCTFPFELAFGRITISDTKINTPYYKDGFLQFMSTFHQTISISDFKIGFDGKNEGDEEIEDKSFTLIQDIESTITIDDVTLTGTVFQRGTIFSLQKSDVTIKNSVFRNFVSIKTPLYTCDSCSREIIQLT
mmetsp:Transcript_6193/g.5599  ORF Transcript_6193/g.5599 Transcript_6193/m.5599 type:complete len:177 (+) Transcript_6193:1303-1833(+)